MKKFGKLLALLLAAALLAGCSRQLTGDMTRYEDMTYTRPNMARMEHMLSLAVDAAMAEEYGGKLRDVLSAIYAFYDEYDSFYTNYSLADIRSCHDLTDLYWQEEYAWCMEKSADVEALLEELYRQLAASPSREMLEAEAYFGEGFFDAYDGESTYDEAFLMLLEQESALISEYYDLSSEATDYDYGTEEYYDACGEDMAQLLVELIALRQQIAQYWGYDSYPQFANDFYFYRDYTMEEAEQYLKEVAQYLSPIYTQLDWEHNWELSEQYCTEEEAFRYVKETAKKMGGTVQEAFSLMDAAGLYDITWSENKYSASFEVYLTSYYEPFIFMNPERSRYDCLTFAHEFGHFCNDYACYGSYAGVDVLEFFSQGMEYLSLCYGEDTEDLKQIKMTDSLSIYVEQAAFASFEQRMYALEGEELTEENLYRLYEEVVAEYGLDIFGYDRREFVTITHFYTSPMYILSYVFSNDAAMQLYQLEQQESGAGLKLYQDNLASQEAWFLAFLETVGLESPFADGRLEKIADTFREILR